jgi:hypothetical protein
MVLGQVSVRVGQENHRAGDSSSDRYCGQAVRTAVGTVLVYTEYIIDGAILTLTSTGQVLSDLWYFEGFKHQII